MHIIISSYSKNSLALIQWAAEKRLQQVTVCHVETGWSAEGWPEFVSRAEAFVRGKGFDAQRLVSRVTFADLMDIKRGFPSREHQWCSLHLKGITLLQWLDEMDPECQATLLMGNRNPEQLTEKPVPEYVESSEYLGGRRLWYPLFELGDRERDALLSRTGLNPPAGGGCAPCINASHTEYRPAGEAARRRRSAPLQIRLQRGIRLRRVTLFTRRKGPPSPPFPGRYGTPAHSTPHGAPPGWDRRYSNYRQ